MGLYEYLHEYDAYDSLMITLESIQEVVAYANYQEKMRDRAADMIMLFEDGNPEEAKATANKNIFEKIGSKIRELIEKIKEFISWITDKIKDIIPGMKSDAEKANQILKDNPDLRNQIIMAYKEGDMSLKDIASLEKDVESVMRLYEAGKIDEDTASGKIHNAIEKFNKSGATIIKTAGTVAGLIGAIGVVTTAIVKMRGSNKAFQGLIENYRDNLDKIRVNNPRGSKVGQVLSALSQTIGLTSEESKKAISIGSRMKKALSSFVKKNSESSGSKTAAEEAESSVLKIIEKIEESSAGQTGAKKKAAEDKISLAKTLLAYVRRTGEIPNAGSQNANSPGNIGMVLKLMKDGKTPSEIAKSK